MLPTLSRSRTREGHIILRAQTGCDHCLEGLAEIRKGALDRLTLRGFAPVFISPESLPPLAAVDANPLLSSPVVGDAINDLMVAQKASAALVVTWQTSDEDVDSMHPDEKKYQLQLHLALKDHGRNAGQLELMESDRFEKALTRLLSDAWINLGKTFSDTDHLAIARNRTEVRVSG